MKALLIASGQYVDYEQLLHRIKEYEYIIAVDGGLDHLKKIGYKPDVLIGDLDSLSKEGLQYIESENIETYKYPKDKDYTDLELTLNYCKKNNISEVDIFGATGTRLDHSFGNLMLLKKAKNMEIKARLIDNYNEIYYVTDRLTMRKKDKYYLSIIPLNDEGIIANLEGFKYSGENIRMFQTDTLGISNEIDEESGEIIILKGEAFIFYSRD